MSITLQGHTLNQRQLDAITPVLNDLMHGKVTQKKFDAACIVALETAGCPLGYDTSMPGQDKSIMVRAEEWLLNGRTGSSSKAIYHHMTGRTDVERMPYPSDPDDLNRCLLLLDLIPEWRPRMPEMTVRGKAWEGLASNWVEITGTFLDEVGRDWCNAKKAPKTYALMKSAIGGHQEPGVWHIQL